MLYCTHWEGFDEPTWEPENCFFNNTVLAIYKASMQLEEEGQDEEEPCFYARKRLQNIAENQDRIRRGCRSSGLHRPGVLIFRFCACMCVHITVAALAFVHARVCILLGLLWEGAAMPLSFSPSCLCSCVCSCV